MAQNFTDLMLRKLTAGGQDRLEIWDARIPGFGLRVSGAGTKTFVLVYRHRGRPRRMTLGRYPVLSLADARIKATQALLAVNEGTDPGLIEQDEKDSAYQFDAAVTAFVKTHCAVHNKASTAKETERLLRKHFVSAWKKRDVRDIRPAHVNKVLDALMEAGKPSEANHALGVIKTLFGWCVERDMIAVSPCTKIKKPAKHGSRSRALSEAELSRLWSVLDGEGYPFGTMTKLLILTGQRRGEVTQMKWSQLDLTAKTWLIPAELSKNGREHLVPLSDHALAVIATIPKTDNDLVFPARGNGENVVSGFTRAKNRLDRLSGLADWTLHDLRRTTATHLGKLGTPPHVIERVLNHVSGSFAGVAGIYNRHPYFEEMKAALQAWGERIAQLSAEPVTLPPEMPPL